MSRIEEQEESKETSNIVTNDAPTEEMLQPPVSRNFSNLRVAGSELPVEIPYEDKLSSGRYIIKASTASNPSCSDDNTINIYERHVPMFQRLYLNKEQSDQLELDLFSDEEKTPRGIIYH